MRILIYSLDTAGLDGLLHCRAMAHALVDATQDAYAIIVSGSHHTRAIQPQPRMDFVKIPSLQTAEGYFPLVELVAWRTRIIHATAAAFRPDMFILDAPPLGLNDELLPTLRLLRKRRCKLVASRCKETGRAHDIRTAFHGLRTIPTAGPPRRSA